MSGLREHGRGAGRGASILTLCVSIWVLQREQKVESDGIMPVFCIQGYHKGINVYNEIWTAVFVGRKFN